MCTFLFCLMTYCTMKSQKLRVLFIHCSTIPTNIPIYKSQINDFLAHSFLESLNTYLKQQILEVPNNTFYLKPQL